MTFPTQTLSNEFRINYCKLWQSLIKSDLEGIKQSSKVLGVEEMYGLLACILTTRSWDVVTTGIDQGPVTEDEVCMGSMYHWIEMCEENLGLVHQ